MFGSVTLYDTIPKIDITLDRELICEKQLSFTLKKNDDNCKFHGCRSWKYNLIAQKISWTKNQSEEII